MKPSAVRPLVDDRRRPPPEWEVESGSSEVVYFEEKDCFRLSLSAVVVVSMLAATVSNPSAVRVRGWACSLCAGRRRSAAASLGLVTCTLVSEKVAQCRSATYMTEFPRDNERGGRLFGAHGSILLEVALQRMLDNTG